MKLLNYNEMILNQNDMILTTIISSKFLKICFIYGLTMTGIVVAEQQLTDADVLVRALESTPSVIIAAFGVVWIGAKMIKAIMEAAKSVSDAWSHHEHNKIKLKESKEHLEREEIETDIKRKDL